MDPVGVGSPFSSSSRMAAEQVSDELVRRALGGKNMLLTGATGFIGKVLLEKHLRSVILPRCSCIPNGHNTTVPCNAGKVFVLVRPKAPRFPTARDRLIGDLYP